VSEAAETGAALNFNPWGQRSRSDWQSNHV